MRPTLVILARVGHRKRIVYQLNDRFTENGKLNIYITVMNETGENIGCDVTLKRMLEKGFIQRDLIKLVLQNIKR